MNEDDFLKPEFPGPEFRSAESVEFLMATALGTRVVVRTRIPNGFTDAVGYLRSCDRVQCTVETKHGVVSLKLADVTAAKHVPEPPTPRTRLQR